MFFFVFLLSTFWNYFIISKGREQFLMIIIIFWFKIYKYLFENTGSFLENPGSFLGKSRSLSGIPGSFYELHLL